MVHATRQQTKRTRSGRAYSASACVALGRKRPKLVAKAETSAAPPKRRAQRQPRRGLRKTLCRVEHLDWNPIVYDEDVIGVTYPLDLMLQWHALCDRCQDIPDTLYDALPFAALTDLRALVKRELNRLAQASPRRDYVERVRGAVEDALARGMCS